MNSGIKEPTELSTLKPPIIGELEILIVNIMGTKFGIDGEQVEEMIELEEAQVRGYYIHHFADKFSFGDQAKVMIKAPIVLIAKGDIENALYIELPEDITRVSVDCIRAVPPLVTILSEISPIWGVAMTSNGIIFLVDVHRLLP